MMIQATTSRGSMLYARSARLLRCALLAALAVGLLPALAVAQVATPNVGSVTFSLQATGTLSGLQQIRITNTGSATLTISTVTVAGANASSFPSSNTCGAPLAAGAFCSIDVTFEPVGIGAKTASVNIVSNSTGGTLMIGLNGTGYTPTAGLSVSPTSLAFGSQEIGVASAAQIVTVTNTTAAAATVKSVSPGGANSPSFPLANTCGSPLAVGGQCTISVTFSPGGAGAKSAAVILSTTAAGGASSVSLTGTGVSPTASLTASPTQLTFANQEIGVMSTPQLFTITNTTAAAVTLNAVYLGGANVPSFGTSNNCPASLAVEASCTISATFKPGGTGAKSASVNVPSTAASSPTMVSLSGTGVAPSSQVTVSPQSLIFGNEPLGITSPPQLLQVTNTTAATLTINAPTLSGANPASFAVASNCSAPLTVGASCTISVTFKPLTALARTAQVNVTSSASSSAAVSAVSGTGVTAATALTLSPTSLSFGNQPYGTSSAAQTITVTNATASSVTINAVSLGGANVPAFPTTTTCGATLAVEASCTISVAFTPPSSGAKSADVSIANSASSSPILVALSGTGAVSVPNVVGKTQTAASTTITTAGLTVGTVTMASSSTVPSGDVISESPAAGTVVASGSAVNLVVSSGGGSSGSPAVWIPFQATPLAAGGLTGLFLQASNNYTAPTGANFVTTSAVTILSSSYAETVSGTNYTAVGRVLIYEGVGGDGNLHLYGLDLRNASSGTLPVPTQLSNLSISASSNVPICDFGNSQTSQLDPTTQFVVLHLPGTGDVCGTDTSTGDSWILVSYGTAASAAPTTLSITTTDVGDAVYGSLTSSLAGFVTLNSTNNTVYYYPYSGGTYSSPVALQTDVCSSESAIGANTGGRIYLVTSGTNCDVTNPEYLYWLTYSGSGTPSYTQVFALAGTATFLIRDDNNYFLTDTVSGGTVYIRQGSLSTGEVTTTLYSFPQSTTSNVQLEGSNDTLMLVDQSTKSGATTSHTLGTLPVGTASTSISTVESLGTLAVAPAVNWAATNELLYSTRGNIYITEYQTAGSASTQVITPTGTVLQSLLAHSAFGLDGIIYPGILQFKGITDTSGETLGGATVYAVSTSGTGLASTAFTLPAGGAYTVPANTITEFDYEAVSSSYLLGGIEFVNESEELVTGGIYNVSSAVVFPFSFANTEIALAEAD